MGIHGDIEETKKLWSHASFPTKALLIVFTFLNFSSITSLADTVFKWKGFILDGVSFYQKWVRNPISEILSFISVPQELTDYIISTVIMISIHNRTKTGKSKWYSERRDLYFFTIGVSALILILSLVTFLHPSGSPFYNLFGALLFYGIVMAANKLDRLRYFATVLFLLFSVLCLAAINVGLLKPI